MGLFGDFRRAALASARSESLLAVVAQRLLVAPICLRVRTGVDVVSARLRSIQSIALLNNWAPVLRDSRDVPREVR
jgi:hypothetical protein